MKPARRASSGPKKSAARSTNRAVIALAVMAGLVVLYGWNSYFLAPRSKARAAVQQDLTASKKQEQDLRQNLVQLKNLAGNTQAREAELIRLGRLIPADPDVAGAILALNDTADQSGVAWSSFVPTPPTGNAGGPATMAISMKLSGSFGQLFDYLRRLESLDRLVVVDSIALSSSGGTGSPRIDADIKGRMFAAGIVAPAPVAATAVAGSTVAPRIQTALPKGGN